MAGHSGLLIAGLDVGAKNVHAVLIRNGDVVARATVLSGFDHEESAARGLAELARIAAIPIEEVRTVAATGAGRNSLSSASHRPSEIAADGRGAVDLYPKARTVVDVGADVARVLRLDAAGRVVDFATNERCAAGAGAFVEAMSRALDMSLDEFALASLASTRSIAMNAQCTVFAESEVVSLIHANTPASDIAKAVHDAMAARVAALVRRVGVEDPVVLAGGVSLNAGFAKSLSEVLGGVDLYIPADAEFMGAQGAALLAWDAAGED